MNKCRKLTEATKKIIAHRQKYLCYKCNNLLPPSFQIDHIIPHSISNDDSEENLQALCPNCHSVKTQRENNRISKFKILMTKCPKNTNICWFCLETTDNMNKHLNLCSKSLKNIDEIIQEQKKTVSTFEEILNKHRYIERELSDTFKQIKIINNVLSIEICLYNFCVYINKNFIYKLRDYEDLFPSDIADAIYHATRSKKFSTTIDTIEINIIDNKESEHFEDNKNKCYEYLCDVLLEYIPERILKKRNNIVEEPCFILL